MKDKRNIHLKVQELCGCFATVGYLEKMTKYRAGTLPYPSSYRSRAMLRRLTLLLMPLALLLMASPVWAAGPTQTLVVKQGQVFQVTLAANHTTGYKWMLAKVPNAKVVKLVTNNYVPDKAERPDGRRLKGVGGHEVWTFQAMGPGMAMILLNYVRPWEKDKKPARVRSLEVEVR